MTVTAGSERAHFLFLNLGHFYSHFFMLVFATVSALRLAAEWEMAYASLIPYATPGFVAFGLCALPAGWMADKWSKEGMLALFFVGIGASSVVTALSGSPLQLGAGLFFIGLFASIYHPVGLALVVQNSRTLGMPIAVNGVVGNMGVAAAALITGMLIDLLGWRAAFALPGGIAVLTGAAYVVFTRWARSATVHTGTAIVEGVGQPEVQTPHRSWLMHVFAVVFLTTAVGGLIFQSTTFALPKVLDEQLREIASSPSRVGVYAFGVFSFAAIGQLVVGYLLDRYSVRLVFASVAVTQIACFAAMPGTDGWGALVVATGFMLAVFGQIPINDFLVGSVVRSEWRSRAFALRYVVTFSVMALSVPVIAMVHRNWGFDTLFLLLCIASATILAAVLTLPINSRMARDKEAFTKVTKPG